MTDDDIAPRPLTKSRTERFAESSQHYPFVVAVLAAGWRVIECADDIQWVVQKQTTNRGKTQWNSESFCRTKEALLRCIKERNAGELPPSVLALPDRYPDGHRTPVPAMEGGFGAEGSPESLRAFPGLSHVQLAATRLDYARKYPGATAAQIDVAIKAVLVPGSTIGREIRDVEREALARAGYAAGVGHDSTASDAFKRLQGNATLSSWRPSGAGSDMPDIPKFLQRSPKPVFRQTDVVTPTSPPEAPELPLGPVGLPRAVGGWSGVSTGVTGSAG